MAWSGHTAAMLAPYANKATTGSLNFSPEALTSLVAALDKDGWRILIHAIGDGAVRVSLDAIAHAAKVNPAPARVAVTGWSTSRRSIRPTSRASVPSA